MPTEHKGYARLLKKIFRERPYDDITQVISLIDEMVAALSEKEASILKAHFGLSGEPPSTLRAIGERWGRSDENMRQVEAQAIRRLRHPSRSNRLRILLWPKPLADS